MATRSLSGSGIQMMENIRSANGYLRVEIPHLPLEFVLVEVRCVQICS